MDVSREGKLITDCLVLAGVSETVASAARSASDRWWAPIGVLALLAPVLVVLTVTFPPDAYTSLLMARSPFSEGY